MSVPVYTDKDLYDANGRPNSSDIVQGGLGDCYYVAPLGSIASHQPQTIQHAIHYNGADQTFNVTLYKEGADHKPEPVTVTVTQSDLQGDRAIGVDSQRYWNKPESPPLWPPLWPQVMESAYAKLQAEYPKEPIKDELAHIGKGGYSSNTIYALTGQHDTTVPASALQDQGKAYTQLHKALQEGRPMLLSTNAMQDMPHDGLIKGEWDNDPAKRSGHAYMVEKVTKDAHGDVMLTVRNPWGRNNDKAQGVDSPDATTHVKLKEITGNGHLQGIDIGPAPAHQHAHTQHTDTHAHHAHPHAQPQHEQTGTQSLTGDHHVDRLIATMNDPVALKQAMTDLTNSPQGEAFRAQGQALHAAQQNQQLQQQPAQPQVQQQAQQAPVMVITR